MEIAFIGIGRMGRPMVERLAAAGHSVHVQNRTRAKAEALAGAPVTVADTAGEAAGRAHVVLTCLPTPAEVERVYGEL